MTGNHNGNGIVAISSPDGSDCLGIAHSLCHVAIGTGFAVGNLPERTQHLCLEGAGIRRQLEIKGLSP